LQQVEIPISGNQKEILEHGFVIVTELIFLSFFRVSTISVTKKVFILWARIELFRYKIKKIILLFQLIIIKFKQLNLPGQNL